MSFLNANIRIYKKGWQLKNWGLQTMVLEKTLESPLDSKEIKPVNPKGNQLWIFTGRTDAEIEVPILCIPDAKTRLIRKDLDAGKERLKAGGEGDGRGWDGCMASSTQWTGVWAISGRWWRSGKSGVLQSMGSQRVRHCWAAEQQPLCKSTMKSVETVFWIFIFSWLVMCSLIFSYDARQVREPQFLASWVMLRINK